MLLRLLLLILYDLKGHVSVRAFSLGTVPTGMMSVACIVTCGWWSCSSYIIVLLRFVESLVVVLRELFGWVLVVSLVLPVLVIENLLRVLYRLLLLCVIIWVIWFFLFIFLVADFSLLFFLILFIVFLFFVSEIEFLRLEHILWVGRGLLRLALMDVYELGRNLLLWLLV